MTQKIETFDWTEVTGLDADSNYMLQAQLTDNFRLGQAMWIQSATEPQSDDLGIMADTIKLSGATKVYVKVTILPTMIVAQAV